MFDPTKPVECAYADGSVCPARIVATDRRGAFPIVALINADHDLEWIGTFNLDGWNGSGHHLRNTIEKRTGWVNVYGLKSGYLWLGDPHKSQKEADEAVGKEDNRVRVSRLKLEILIGQFDEE